MSQVQHDVNSEYRIRKKSEPMLFARVRSPQINRTSGRAAISTTWNWTYFFDPTGTDDENNMKCNVK